ncbi:MAG: molecular chaperone DnaK [Candidatus Calescibacterium sp.]|nr:molecular chaperone DnaK [Candidatus Calescibacterium sp.]MCX7971876.1 molecular chaperone DnaK [bacterium]MDW8195025.1 molecular chaperone DnaK [Candidatus Calescibacterium sp.]
MPKIIGIDLGTTNTVMAIMEGGKPVVIPNSEGDYLTPSIVSFTKTGERIVGALAKRQLILNPDRTIKSIKRKMGTDYKVKIDNKEYTPQEISAMILQKIKLDCESYLDTKIDKAVITVPAHFDDAQRQATKDAGTIAGLEVVRILNEPTAAAMAYGFDKQQKIQTIVVFDLGGGTFDVSILEIGEGVYQVLGTAGDNFLGGDDWDERIMNWIINRFYEEHRIDLKIQKEALQKILEASERAKIELSTKEETTIKIPFITSDARGAKHINYTLTRKEFEEITKDLVERLIIPVEEAFKAANIRYSQVDEVILVGGSTRMPMVQQMAKKIFNREPRKDIDPEKVVALGAAIQAGIIEGNVKEMVLLDVTSLSLGVETAGGGFTKIIPRNTQIPTKKTKIFTTVQDGQSAVEIHILQGERELAKYNKSLARFELVGIPPAPKGVPKIEVTFEIDADGILHVSAVDLATGNKQKVVIHSVLHLDRSEVERMLEEASKYAQIDRKIREEQQIISQANVELDSAENIIKNHSELLDLKIIEKAKKVIETLKLAINAKKFDEIKKLTEELRSINFSLGTELYNIMEKQIAQQKEQTEASQQQTKTKDSSILEQIKKVTDEDILSWFKKKKEG